MLTTTEAAIRLGIKPRSVNQLIRNCVLPARSATPDEVAELLRSGRIKGVPPTGVKVIDDDVFGRYLRERRPPHRPKRMREG